MAFDLVQLYSWFVVDDQAQVDTAAVVEVLDKEQKGPVELEHNLEAW